ncbi:hypothetical protein PtB15_18B267 [Puccinia triticina]|nr:hypothetical protein PtB15_18B267 [Puccinia triticina]
MSSPNQCRSSQTQTRPFQIGEREKETCIDPSSIQASWRERINREGKKEEKK